MLTIYFLLTHSAEDNCQDAESDDGDKDKNCAVHEEILGKNTDDLVLPPAEEPVRLTGEEELVENGERTVKVGCRKATDNGKAGEGE